MPLNIVQVICRFYYSIPQTTVQTSCYSDIDFSDGGPGEHDDMATSSAEISEIEFGKTTAGTRNSSSLGKIRKLKRALRTFHKEEWEDKYLVTVEHSESAGRETPICILCEQTFQDMKVYSFQRHLDRKHKTQMAAMRKWSAEQRKRIVENFHQKREFQRKRMEKATTPEKLQRLAPLKLAYTLAKHNIPLSKSSCIVEFSRAADPTSKVLEKMAAGRTTITNGVIDIREKVLISETKSTICASPFWSVVIDESLDVTTKEQMIVYARCIDLQTCEVATNFLCLHRLSGHPDAENIASSLLDVLGESGFNLPLDRLVCLSTDGASVLRSPINGVIAKLRERLDNPLLLSQHCCTHRLVLCAKDARKELPKFVEKTIESIMNYFQGSAVRRDKFGEHRVKSLEDLTDPEGAYMTLVTYHKVRWLSLSDCVQRLWDLLQPLVTFFEEETGDQRNQPKVRKLAADLHEQISKPEFHLYLSFLEKPLRDLAAVNRHLQTRNQTLYTTCCGILALQRTLSYYVKSNDADGQEKERSVREAVSLAGGEGFRKLLKETEDNALLNTREIQAALKSMHNFLLQTVESISRRFSELDFFVQKCQMLDPVNRRRVQAKDLQAIAVKFKHSAIDEELVSRQAVTYSFDESLDLLYTEQCGMSAVKFFISLLHNENYCEIGKLALLLYSLAPDSVEAERGFSLMNITKNCSRNRLGQRTINAIMAIASDSRGMDTFPFDKVLNNNVL